MPVWREKKGWRYRFQYEGEKYNRSWFATKAAARAEEEAHKARLKRAAKTPTAMVFSELANDYLDWSKRRHATKTYKAKAFIYRAFLEFAGDIRVTNLNLPLLESYLRTRRTNTNYNRHRKDLCALLVWACTVDTRLVF